MRSVVVHKVPDTGDRETERLRDGETEKATLRQSSQSSNAGSSASVRII